MEVHKSSTSKRPGYLLLDASERVAVLPTDFIKCLSSAPSNRAKGTLDLYANRLRDFCSFLEDHDVYGQICVDDAVRAMSLPVIDEFYRACIAKGLEATTTRGYEVVLKLFTNWLTTEVAGREKANALYENISYRTPRPSKRMPRYMTVEQVIKLASGLHWELHRLITHFIFDTGLRVSEIPRVLKSDLPHVENYPSTQMYFPLLVRGSKGRGGKIKERYTIISKPMLIRVQRYFKSRTYFTNHDWSEAQKPAFLNTYGMAIQTKAIQKFLADGLARTDLSAASAHRLRHGTAYSVMRSEHGKSFLDNLVVTQRMLGHSDLSTTEIYTNIPAPVLQRMNERMASGEPLLRFEEAQRIFDETYLSEKKQPILRKIGYERTT